MRSSEKLNELTKAMSQFQSRLTTLAKDTKAYNYKYTTLASIWESFRPLLAELGLFIFQDVVTSPEGVKIATRITHISDQWIETDYILIPMGKKDAHSTGSATSYGRRYSLSCALGIVTEDDDGQAAQDGSKHAKNPGKPEMKKATQEEFNDFVDAWSQSYDNKMIKEYIQAYSAHYKCSDLASVAIFMKDQNRFGENLGIWIAKQEKNI